MLKVAPIWRVAALALPLAAAGCDWIPVRRRLDPSLYPVPSRPQAAYLRGDRPKERLVPTAAVGSSAPPALARDPGRRDLPTLPELRPVSPEEALGPRATTPLLDEALLRTEAVRSAALDHHSGTAETTGDVLPSRAIGLESATTSAVVAAESGEETGGTVAPEPAGPELPPIAEPFACPAPDPGIAETVSTVSEKGSPLVDVPPLEPIPPGIDPGPPPINGEMEARPRADAAVEPDDHWRAGLANLLELAREEAARGDGTAEVWASRRRVLDWLAQAEGQVDDATLWQTVMVMLAEPEEEEVAPVPVAPVRAETPSLRVSRVAFCREVAGFGRIVPIDEEAIRPGRDVIVYCELEGVRYEEEGEGHSSRLSTAMEIAPEEDATAVWREVRPVEDRCSQPRRDYFVSYRLTLPGTLPAGDYRLNVSQHDLISGGEASGSLPFTIVTDER